MAQIDCFIKIDGVRGECRDQAHKGEIDVLAWTFGASRGEGSAPEFQNLIITKTVDVASASMFRALGQNSRVSEVVMTCRKAGKTPLDFLVITLNNCRILDIIQSGGAGDESGTAETVTIGYMTVSITCTEQNDDGSSGSEIEFFWDVSQNQ